MHAVLRCFNWILPGFLLLPVFSFAQTFRISQYTTHEGLPIDNVYAAAQDSTGVIWFGTDFGIARYDGYRFTTYNQQNGMAGKAVTDIVYAGGDSLIFFAYPFAIQSIHFNGRINTITSNSGNALQQLVKHGSDYVYYKRGDNKYGLLQNGQTRMIKADSAFGTNGLQVNCIFSAGEQGLVFCTNKGLFIKHKEVIVNQLPDHPIQWGLFSVNKHMLLVSGPSIFEQAGNGIFKARPLMLPAALTVLHMADEADGTLWIRGLDQGVYRVHDNRIEEMSDKLRLNHIAMNEFFRDGDGNFWYCTDGAGILLKKRSGFKTYETTDGLANNKVLRLLKQHGELLIGTSNGLSVMRSGTLQKIDLPVSGSGLKYVYQLFPAFNNRTGISIEKSFNFSVKPNYPGGMVIEQMVNERKFRAFKTPFAWQQDSMNSWMLSGAKLIHQVTGKSIPDSFDLAPYHVRKGYCMIQYKGQLWLGTDAGIIRLDQQQLSKTDSIGVEKLGQVFAFCTDRQKRLWAATDIGLFLYEEGRFITMPKGNTIGSNYCTALSEGADGRIWVATWDGIYSTDGSMRKYYNTQDGLPSKTVNAILYDTSDRLLYVGTANGLAVFNNPVVSGSTSVRKLKISCSVVGSDSMIVDMAKELSAGHYNLGFYLNFPYFQGGEALTYEYKMDNGNWSKGETPLFFKTRSTGFSAN